MSTTTVPYAFEKEGFLPKWVLADTLGLVVGVFVTPFLFYGIENYFPDYHILNEFLLPLAWILAVNMPTGFGEQLVLKRHLKAGLAWFRVSAIGTVLCALLCAILMITVWYLKIDDYESLSTPASLILVILFILFLGLIPGLSQWRALREIVPHASLWIWVKSLVSTGVLVGSLFVLVLCLLMGPAVGYGEGEGGPLFWILFVFFILFLPTLILGVASGAIYGAVMRKLLKEPAAASPV
jgi:membrane protein YdbS with pleckstrin-like domain